MFLCLIKRFFVYFFKEFFLMVSNEKKIRVIPILIALKVYIFQQLNIFYILNPLQTKLVMDLRFSIFLSLIRKGVSTTLNTYIDKVFAKLIANLALSFLAQKIGYVMMQPTVQKVLKPVNYIIGLTFTKIIFQRYVHEDLSSLYSM